MNDPDLFVARPSLTKDLEFIFSQTSSLWEQLRGKQLFITGATGFFGCWLLESFLWANEKLNLNASATLLTRNKNNFCSKYPHLAQNPSFTVFEGDITSFSFPEEQFDYIIHAATDTSSSAENLSIWHTIVDGTRHVLEFAKYCHAKQILFVSSGAVYGRQPHDVTHLSEIHNCQPQLTDHYSTYALGKYTAEHLCFLYAQQYGLEIKIARCFAFVGPYISLTSSFAIANFIANGLKGEDIVIQGDGTTYRSYLYMADLTIWLWNILFHGKSLRPYNVGSDQMISLKEVADLVATCFKHRPKVIVKKPAGSNLPERYVPSIQRAQDELGLTPKIDLQSAIQSTIDWYHSAGNIYAN
jgi:dTDP-glucose 4,6-dehydratase